MRPSEIAKDFYTASNQCKDCIFFPKCDEYPFDESGCKDFKDRSRFVELPCKPLDVICWVDVYNRKIRTIKVVSVEINYQGISEFGCIGCPGENFTPTRFKASAIGKTVFLTREEAEAALAERKMNDA